MDDWGRVDDNGKPRELHTELAVGAIDFGEPQRLEHSAVAVKNEPVVLEECPYFTTNILKVEDTCERDYSALDSFVIFICLEGDLNVCYSAGAVPLRKGETVLVPRQEDCIELTGEGTVLETYIE